MVELELVNNLTTYTNMVWGNFGLTMGMKVYYDSMVKIDHSSHL